MITKTHKDDLYAILVYGIVPEFMPHLAFRRVRRSYPVRKKAIKCPHCHEVFITEEATAKLELMRYPRKANITCHRCIPCGICNNEIGIIYAGAYPN